MATLLDATETTAENGEDGATGALEAPIVLPQDLAAASETEKRDDTVIVVVIEVAIGVAIVTATVTVTADADAHPKNQTAVAADAETLPTMKLLGVTAARWLGTEIAPR